MKNIINEMIERINLKIKLTKENFTEWNPAHERRVGEIEGAIEMLSIVTGKNYVVTESGLEER